MHFLWHCLQGRAPQYLMNCCHPRRMLPVVSDFDLPAATISSYHDIVAARSAVGRSPSPVRWSGTRCLTTSETRRSCRHFQEEAEDASVSECTWTRRALEALRNALYKFKIYLLTYLPTCAMTSKIKGQCYNVTSTVWRMFAQNRQQKFTETSKMAERLSAPRVTFRTSSKVHNVKYQGHQAAQHWLKTSHIFGKGRPMNFKFGTRM